MENFEGERALDDNTKKMLEGKPYIPDTNELNHLSQTGHRLCHDYNQLYDTETEQRTAIIDQLMGHHGENCYLQGPIQFDYGRFLTVGNNFYANFNFTVLDTCPVTIGDNVMIGPNVSLVTPLHPLRWQQRNSRTQTNGQFTDLEYGAPITIGNNCWLASNVTVCGGVTIGNGCVIGAGAVVTHDMPDNSLILGVPAKAVRKITRKDHLDFYPY